MFLSWAPNCRYSHTDGRRRAAHWVLLYVKTWKGPHVLAKPEKKQPQTNLELKEIPLCESCLVQGKSRARSLFASRLRGRVQGEDHESNDNLPELSRPPAPHPTAKAGATLRNSPRGRQGAAARPPAGPSPLS